MNLGLRRRIPPLLLAFFGVTINGNGGAQQADGVVIIDGLMWSLTTTAAIPWSEADEHCDTLETDGFTDWRLPTLTELRSLHDPAAPGAIRGPFDLQDCCAWSSLSLADLGAEPKGNLPSPGGAPEGYYWGFLFDGAISYYSNGRFPDGLAICLRQASG